MTKDSSQAVPPVVLFVDDEPSILSALRRLFRPVGYRVLLADSGKAGLAILASEEVNLVVSDMRMPEMDGAQFLEKVREHWPHVVRMLLTGYADIVSTIAAINRGEIHRYIAKPWDDQDLLLCVSDGLMRQRLEQENRALLQLTKTQNDELVHLNADLEQRVLARTQELGQVNDMLHRSFAQLQENFLLSINVFSGLLELRDGGMAGYSRQVAELARRIATKLSGGPQLEQDVYIAGLLHEVGKIGFPDTLLRKPLSELTGEDLARYKKHPLNGEAALLPLAQLQRVARFVRSHRERLDGKGFPDSLAGDDVPFGAQILAVSSDYYALQTGRLAVKRYSAREAAGLVLGGSGTRYDASVVGAFREATEEQLAEKPVDQVIPAHNVEVGMVLARDLLSPQGTLLLAKGFVFDDRVVRQIREFTQREGARLTLYIRLPESDAPRAS